MTLKSPQIWFLLESDKTRGPFTAEQIQELLERGEIQPTDRLLPGPSSNESPVTQEINSIAITVMDLIKSLSNDPTYRLFETLQFARDRKNALKSELVQIPKPLPNEKKLKANLLMTLIVIGSLLALSVLLWLIVTYHSSDSHQAAPQLPSTTDPTLRAPHLGTPSSVLSTPNNASSPSSASIPPTSASEPQPAPPTENQNPSIENPNQTPENTLPPPEEHPPSENGSGTY